MIAVIAFIILGFWMARRHELSLIYPTMERIQGIIRFLLSKHLPFNCRIRILLFHRQNAIDGKSQHSCLTPILKVRLLEYSRIRGSLSTVLNTIYILPLFVCFLTYMSQVTSFTRLKCIATFGLLSISSVWVTIEVLRTIRLIKYYRALPKTLID